MSQSEARVSQSFLSILEKAEQFRWSFRGTCLARIQVDPIVEHLREQVAR